MTWGLSLGSSRKPVTWQALEKRVPLYSLKQYGAIGDGSSHTLSSLGFPTLAAAQFLYPEANSLNDEADLCAIRRAITVMAARGGGKIVDDGVYRINRSIDTCDNLTVAISIKTTSAFGRAAVFRQSALRENVDILGCRFDNSDNLFTYSTDNFPCIFEGQADCVDGLRIEGCHAFGFNSTILLRTRPKRFSLKNNRLLGNRRAGIFVTDPCGGQISGNFVDNILAPGSEWDGSAGFPFPARGTATRGGVGIWVDVTDDGLIDGQICSITDNIVAHTHFEGIIARNRGVTVADNYVFRANHSTAGSTYGLILEGSYGAVDENGATDCSVTGNSVVDCDGGIAVREDPANTSFAGHHVLIAANRVRGLSGGANALQVSMPNATTEHITITANHFDGSGFETPGAGISMGQVNGCIAFGNTILNCSRGIVGYDAQSADIQIISNTIKNCLLNAIEVTALAAGSKVSVLRNVIREINTSASAADFNYVAINIGSSVVGVIDDNDIESAANMTYGIRAPNASCTFGENRIVGATTGYYLGVNRPIMPAVEYLYVKTTLDYPEIASGAREYLGVAVTNVALGDTIVGVSGEQSTVDFIVSATISSAGNVRVYFDNRSALAVNPGSMSVRLVIARTSVL